MRYLQYFTIAALSNALMQTKQPETAWDWWIFIAGSLLAGVIATKALQSQPPEAEPPKVEKAKPAPVPASDTFQSKTTTRTRPA